MKEYLKVTLLGFVVLLIVGFLVSPFIGGDDPDYKSEIETAYEEGYSDGYQACMDEYGIPED